MIINHTYHKYYSSYFSFFIRWKNSKSFSFQLKSILILIFTSYSFSAFSEIDTLYIQKYPQDFYAKIYLSNNYSLLTYDSPTLGDGFAFFPTGYLSIGIGAGWRGLSGSINCYTFKRKNEEHTKATDFQIHYYKRKFVFDLFIQDYTGLYLRNNNENSSNYPFYKDIKLKKYGAYSQYMFNGNRFSYRAAFSQNEKQKRSVGSFLLGGGIYYSEVKADSVSLFRQSKIANPEVSGFQLGPSCGYAYTWVFKKNYFITGSMSVGINVAFEKANYAEEKTSIYPTLFPRFSAGYNDDSWSINLSYINDLIYASAFDGARMSLNTGNIQLSFVKHIDFNYHPKFLDDSPKIVKQAIGYE